MIMSFPIIFFLNRHYLAKFLSTRLLSDDDVCGPLVMHGPVVFQ